jgi:hypothetical protein
MPASKRRHSDDAASAGSAHFRQDRVNCIEQTVYVYVDYGGEVARRNFAPISLAHICSGISHQSRNRTEFPFYFGNNSGHGHPIADVSTIAPTVRANLFGGALDRFAVATSYRDRPAVSGESQGDC